MRIMVPAPEVKPGMRFRKKEWGSREYISWDGRGWFDERGFAVGDSMFQADDFEEVQSDPPAPMTLLEACQTPEAKAGKCVYQRSLASFLFDLGRDGILRYTLTGDPAIVTVAMLTATDWAVEGRE